MKHIQSKWEFNNFSFIFSEGQILPLLVLTKTQNKMEKASFIISRSLGWFEWASTTVKITTKMLTNLLVVYSIYRKKFWRQYRTFVDWLNMCFYKYYILVCKMIGKASEWSLLYECEVYVGFLMGLRYWRNLISIVDCCNTSVNVYYSTAQSAALFESFRSLSFKIKWLLYWYILKRKYWRICV